jgi:succinate dehydrogenase / fumarate reductase membrane anchor subunit
MVGRSVSGARYGVRDWLVQRVSAAYMAVYTLVLFALLARQPISYASWRGLFESAPMRYATLLFALSLYLHAWVGVRDIFMDYLKPTWLRLAAEAASILALVLYAAWTVSILWSLP